MSVSSIFKSKHDTDVFMQGFVLGEDGKGHSKAVLESLSVSENGDYEPAEGLDGFNHVHVDVKPNIQPLTVTENGTYYASDYGCTGFDPVNVNNLYEILYKAEHDTESITEDTNFGKDSEGNDVVLPGIDMSLDELNELLSKMIDAKEIVLGCPSAGVIVKIFVRWWDNEPGKPCIPGGGSSPIVKAIHLSSGSTSSSAGMSNGTNYYQTGDAVAYDKISSPKITVSQLMYGGAVLNVNFTRTCTTYGTSRENMNTSLFGMHYSQFSTVGWSYLPYGYPEDQY